MTEKNIKSRPTSRIDRDYFLPLKQLKLKENQLSFVYTKRCERLRLVYIVVPKKNIIGSTTVIKTGTLNNIKYTRCVDGLKDTRIVTWIFITLGEPLEKKITMNGTKYVD